MSRKPTTEDRFWAKVAKGDGPDACWMWTAAVQTTGYGAFGLPSTDGSPRRVVLAHRYAYELANGTIEEGAQLDHLCPNALCVNPDHLTLGAKRGSRSKRSDPDYVIDAVTGCWLWCKSLTGAGYGRSNRGDHILAHRMYYEDRHGTFDGELHHLCEIPRCVNPDHLVPLSHLDHMHCHVVKHSWETVTRARELRASGCTYVEVAVTTGIPRGTVSAYLNNRSRRHK